VEVDTKWVLIKHLIAGFYQPFLLFLQVQVPGLKNPEVCNTRSYRWWSTHIWGCVLV